MHDHHAHYQEEKRAWFVLEDGSSFEGEAIGTPGETFGEVVFNTSLTGYQEILTDPSYCGQIVLMTYPEIGNYGVNQADYESGKIHAAGLVVKHLSPVASSWRSERTLNDFLTANRLTGISNVDTRAITRKIRLKGAMKAGITTDMRMLEQGRYRQEFIMSVTAQPDLTELDLVGQVSPSEPYVYKSNDISEKWGMTSGLDAHEKLNTLVVVDFGIKKSILDYLAYYTRQLMVVPANTGFEKIMSYHPDGVLLSNGPGDPLVLTDAIAMARQLIAHRVPTFGICLGHQILAVASGARVEKMRFGHHGGNHPVKDLETGQITITSQNHGFAAVMEDFPVGHLTVTHVNLNDGSIEGFRHRNAPVSSVQFHPEAHPGPHDADYLFARFVREALDYQQALPLPA